MSALSAIGNFFKKLGRLLQKGLNVAVARGLSDDLLKAALTLAKEAALKFADNAAKREWVVAQLVARGLPEGVARIAVELAVNLLKKEAAKV